jgi:hypothetical protein
MKVTIRDCENQVERVNAMLESQGKNYRIEMSHRYDYWGIDETPYPNSGHTINRTRMTGSKKECYLYLDGMLS